MSVEAHELARALFLVLGALCAFGTCLVLGALCLVNENALPKLRSNSPSTKHKAQRRSRYKAQRRSRYKAQRRSRYKAAPHDHRIHRRARALLL